MATFSDIETKLNSISDKIDKLLQKMEEDEKIFKKLEQKG